jgi:putative ATPase
MQQIPLAERLRPNTLDEYIGQEHILGKDKPLRKLIAKGNVPSMILWGPPGVGKTTLAHIISKTLDRPFYALSAINSGVKEVREVIDSAKKSGPIGGHPFCLLMRFIVLVSRNRIVYWVR